MFANNYNFFYHESIAKPEEFWDKIASEVVWSKAYTNVLEDKFSHSPKWFVGGELNMSYNCLDRNVNDGYGDKVAVIHDSPVTGSIRSFTYKQLLESVSLLAGVMAKRFRIKKGDIVLLYFPVIPECLMAMLACTRIGAVYTIVYGGFSVIEFSKRIRHIEPKLIITCNAGPEGKEVLYYKEKLDQAVKLSGISQRNCLVYNRPNFKSACMNSNFDFDWTTELRSAEPRKSVPVESNHPIFILHTSGTTGDPKGMVQSTGNSVVYNHYLLKYLFGLKPKDVIWCHSTFAWILGQSVLTYASLLCRTRTVLFEGSLIGTPDNAQFARVLNFYKVKMVLCLPRVMKILQRNCTEDDLKINYQGLSVYLGGEPTDPFIRDWIKETFSCQVYNSWGETELGGVVTASLYGGQQEDNPNDMSMLQMPGIDIRVVDKESGLELPRGQSGRLVIKLPMTPSMMTTIYNDDKQFVKSYFTKYPGFFDTMDIGIVSDDDRFQVIARDGEVIQLGGANICQSSVEFAILKNDNVAEAVVVEFEDKLKGPVPFGFLILKEVVTDSIEQIIQQTIEIVRDTIGEVALFKNVVIVSDVPMILSRKIQRNSLTAMVNGKQFKVPASVVNAHVYPAIYDVLLKAGYNPTLPT